MQVVDETQDAWPTGRAPVFAAMAPMDNIDNIRDLLSTRIRCSAMIWAVADRQTSP